MVFVGEAGRLSIVVMLHHVPAAGFLWTGLELVESIFVL